MKKNKLYFFKAALIIILTVSIQYVFSQSSVNLAKYWFYRNRLKCFVIPGSKIGESQFVCTRNRMDGNTTDYAGKANVDYGQLGEHDGLYIGVLATEYYLLNKNGQTTDAAKTINDAEGK